MKRLLSGTALVVIVLLLGLFLIRCQRTPFETESSKNLTTYTLRNDGVVTQPLWAGAGQNNTSKGTHVGTVTVYNDATDLHVTYTMFEGYLLSEVHLWVGTDYGEIPKNAAPGKFPYKEELAIPDTEYVFGPIPLDDIDEGWECGDTLFIAAHAVVEFLESALIDFETYDQFDSVMTVSTSVGDVHFYMASRTGLAELDVGESADLSQVDNYYPIIAKPDWDHQTEENAHLKVAFSVNAPPYFYDDRVVYDPEGTGAGGKILTDPLDTTKVDAKMHAYHMNLAIAIDVSNIDNIRIIDLVGIDADHNELWQMLYFDSSDILLYKEEYGPTTTAEGDGKAFPFTYTNPEIDKVVLLGWMNNFDTDYIGYAFDNIRITRAYKDETAWGFGEHEFNDTFLNGNKPISKKWGWFFEYEIYCEQ